MVSQRPRLRASVPALVLAWILALGAPGTTGAASPTPSTGVPGRPGSGVTGHWASPVNMAGIDLIQEGSHLAGSAINGLHIDGTISGRSATFAFWHGASYTSASADKRGHGSLTVSPDGNSATVSWRDENPKGNENGLFQIMRVTSPISGPDPGVEPAPEPGDEALADVDAEVTGMTTGATAAVTEVLLAAIEQAIAAAETALEDAETALDTDTGAVDPNALAEAMRLRQIADGLKVTSDLADRVANTAQLASAEANQALRRAQDNDVGSRQDVLLAQSGVDQATPDLLRLRYGRPRRTRPSRGRRRPRWTPMGSPSRPARS